MIEEKAYAKVNLFLNVLDKRNDGYHNLEMINAKIDLFDNIKFKIIDCPETVIIRSNDLFLSNQDNVVIQVAKYMLRNFQIKSGLEITIEKNIPFGAGLAGNSADSAAVIKGINRLFNLELTNEIMSEIGAMFGADIPYCLIDYPAYVTGIGEKIEKISVDLSSYKVLLINPKEYISTKTVFEFGDKKGFEQKNIHEAKKFLEKNDIAGFKNFMFNSLEQVVVENYQSINDFKKILIDKLGSSGLIMTGSGSTFIKIIGKNEDFSHFTTEYKVNYLVKTYNFL